MAYVDSSIFDATLTAWGLDDVITEGTKTNAKAGAEAWIKAIDMKFRGTADDILGYYATRKAVALAGGACLGNRISADQYPPDLKEAMAECRAFLEMEPDRLAGGINQRRIVRGA